MPQRGRGRRPRRAADRAREPRSRLARQLGHHRIWGKRLDAKTYVGSRRGSAEGGCFLRDGPGGRHELRCRGLAPRGQCDLACSRREGRSDGRPANPYFVSLYRSLADALASGAGFLFGLEGREHTAQVDQMRRQWREWRFRWGTEDRQRLAEAKDEMRQVGEPGVPLPALFCSPTMELGVDISALNAVYLRNVPPTPANYAQRSGRAGRSGQAALVVTYCAAQVRTTSIISSGPKRWSAASCGHQRSNWRTAISFEPTLHAIWLAESGKELASDIPHVLDLTTEALPVQEEVAHAFAAPDLKPRAARGDAARPRQHRCRS